MKIKSGFILHSMGNEHIVVAVEERTEEFRGMIRLNSTGAFLWKRMENQCTEQDLIDGLLEEYAVDRETAQIAVRSFVEQLCSAGVMEP